MSFTVHLIEKKLSALSVNSFTAEVVLTERLAGSVANLMSRSLRLVGLGWKADSQYSDIFLYSTAHADVGLRAVCQV